MAHLFAIHPDTPQPRLLTQVADLLQQGGVIAYPTDSGYALGCCLGNKSGMELIRRIRQFDKQHNFTLVCADLSSIATYAYVDNHQYRMLKGIFPGPYTVILPATKEVPKRLMQEKRKTIGMRIPDNVIAQQLVAAIGEPIMSVSLILPGEELPMMDAYDIKETLGEHLAAVVDGGYCGMEPTSVLDLSDDGVTIVRRGAGDLSLFE